MVLRILSGLDIFPSSMEPKFSMPIMHMFGQIRARSLGLKTPGPAPWQMTKNGQGRLRSSLGLCEDLRLVVFLHI